MDCEDNLPIQHIIFAMADQLGINWQSERLGLYNLTQDVEYSPEDTLVGKATRSGDLVMLADGGSCHKKD
ncbi:MAG: hypothetical protein ACK6BZ_00565 [Candidatus Kapaibacterium sp.]|jgi:hypothetical protein|nr:hypothetical protein [Candidatus Kapabacteria bacterium]